MPYIKESDKTRFIDAEEAIREAFEAGVTPGDLNYIITRTILTYIARKGLSYTHLNDVVGVLDSAKAEFQRRLVGPYEDRKIAENGDVGYETVIRFRG